MAWLKGVIIVPLIILFLTSSVFAISNIQHSVDGNKVTITYDGNPPFWINIRPDESIGQSGGYLWAKTYSNSFTYDMSFANNPSKKFYYGVKDKSWSSTLSFSLEEETNACTDGTPYGKCSITKPLFCSDGYLKNNCDDCRCSNNQICKEDGSCVSDTQTGHNISMIEIYGRSGIPGNETYLIGSVFSLYARISNNNWLASAKAEILLNNNILHKINLTCGEKEEFYNCWGSFLFTNAIEGTNAYTIKILAEDSSGNVSTDSRDFNITFRGINQSLCKELIQGHNNPDANRANIVFVGYGYKEAVNYSDVEILKLLANYSIDWQGAHKGLFSVEPFKSNKNKFNMWYIDMTSPLEYCVINSGCLGWGYCNDYDFLASNCVFSNKYVVNLIDADFRSSDGNPSSISAGVGQALPQCSFKQYCVNVDFDKNGCVNDEDISVFKEYDTQNMTQADIDRNGIINLSDVDIASNCFLLHYGCGNENQCPNLTLVLPFSLDALFVHEFGHEFGWLSDEYIEWGGNFTSIIDNNNCYAGSKHTKDECIQNTQWKNYIGDGCGQNNVIDCKQDVDANYNLEIGCFESCLYREFGIFRSAFSTIMRCHTCEPFSFGLWNEKLIKDKLDLFSS